MAVKMVCKNCGSDKIKKDAFAVWSVERQEWVLDNIYDDEFCGDCESSGNISKEKIVEVEKTVVGFVLKNNDIIIDYLGNEFTVTLKEEANGKRG